MFLLPAEPSNWDFLHKLPKYCITNQQLPQHTLGKISSPFWRAENHLADPSSSQSTIHVINIYIYIFYNIKTIKIKSITLIKPNVWCNYVYYHHKNKIINKFSINIWHTDFSCNLHGLDHIAVKISSVRPLASAILSKCFL